MHVAKSTGKRKRRQKTNLVFDEHKRREFLTGFHKRKLQRKKKAKEDFDRLLKEEKKRIKSEAKDVYKKLNVSLRTIPELENLETEEYDDDEATVKIVELSSDKIAEQNNWIGTNHVKYTNDVSDDEESEGEIQEDEIPGMELKPKKKVKPKTETNFTSKKDIKKEIKKIATKTVKKSKIFQMKNRLEKQKQKKKSIKKAKLKEKFKDKQKFKRK